MHKVFLIGAGQIGSRHLQALKKVAVPLDITVIDPSSASLQISRERYEETSVGKNRHAINYLQEIPKNQKVDLAIVATTSNIRAEVIKNLLKNNRVKYFLLEKLLFDKKKDYQAVEKLFSKLKIKAWVNCPLRLRPLYQKIKEVFVDKNISFRIIGSQLGLATNTVHFLDFASYLAESVDFTINTGFLDKKIIPSKRKGFLELNGTIYAEYQNGLSCAFTSYASENTIPLVEVFNKDTRYIFPFQEADGQALVGHLKNNWQWKKIPFRTHLVSETTAWAVADILQTGRCQLTAYHESAQIHLAFLEPLRKFLNQNSKKKYDYYPFT